ncbi:MAG: sulfite exporter TauE/SafE family protein [Deltaproteobacteria bacterium]|nr:sulfite exporter TauE/SafE family protein [Deltaproteobacteria bacterium]
MKYAADAAEFQSLVLSHGAIGAYFAAFVLGIAADLSPCVYPLIPVTLALIGAKEAPTKLRAFSLSAVYVLGIAVMYTGLGFAVALAGKLGANIIVGFTFQNPWVVGFIALLFIAMGLSLLGLYELRLPAAFQARLSKRRRGIAGIFVMGMVAGVIASPCTGPFLAGLLGYVIVSGELAHGTTLLFAFALGMGLPFLVLGTFAGILGNLPKSGNWMLWVKRGAGVVFLGVAVYVGQYALPREWRQDLFGGKTSGVEAEAVAAAGADAGAGVGAAKVAWHKDEAAAVALAKREKKPVVLDFWGEFCKPCKVMDVEVFANAAVVKELERFIVVKVDSTDDEHPSVKALWKKYGVTGLPTLAFIDSTGRIVHEKKRSGAAKAGAVLAILRSVP